MSDTRPALNPDFITFTGADAQTNLDRMVWLSARFPIEWGILFSPARQGRDPRYPDLTALAPMLETNLTFSAHLCGAHAQAIMDGQLPLLPVSLNAFSRVQINHTAPSIEAIGQFQRLTGVPCIAQTRGEEFPSATSIEWLLDRSGGRGERIAQIPRYPGWRVGYAGGLNAGNIREVITLIDAPGPYWLDMESGVRVNDCFELGAVYAVCKEVFG